MITKTDKLQLKAVISDTIVLLCKNKLSAKLRENFTIEGLIGISIGQKDLLLVSINERLHDQSSESNGCTQLQKTDVPVRNRKRKLKNPVEIPIKVPLIDDSTCSSGTSSMVKQYPLNTIELTTNIGLHGDSHSFPQEFKHTSTPVFPQNVTSIIRQIPEKSNSTPFNISAHDTEASTYGTDSVTPDYLDVSVKLEPDEFAQSNEDMAMVTYQEPLNETSQFNTIGKEEESLKDCRPNIYPILLIPSEQAGACGNAHHIPVAGQKSYLQQNKADAKSTTIQYITGVNGTSFKVIKPKSESAEKKKTWREKLRLDKDRYEKFKEKDRIRKRNAKYLPKTPDQKTAEREKYRIMKRNYRAKLKNGKTKEINYEET